MRRGRPQIFAHILPDPKVGRAQCAKPAAPRPIRAAGWPLLHGKPWTACERKRDGSRRVAAGRRAWKARQRTLAWWRGRVWAAHAVAVIDDQVVVLPWQHGRPLDACARERVAPPRCQSQRRWLERPEDGGGAREAKDIPAGGRVGEGSVRDHRTPSSPRRPHSAWRPLQLVGALVGLGLVNCKEAAGQRRIGRRTVEHRINC